MFLKHIAFDMTETGSEFPPPLLRCVVGEVPQSDKGRSRHQRCKPNRNHTGELAGGPVRKWRKSRRLRQGSSQLSVPGIQDQGEGGRAEQVGALG